MSDEIPTTAEEMLQKENPAHVGTLTEEELNLLNSMRASSSQVILQVGQLEVRKARLLSQLGDIEDRANALVAKATQRFGVEGGPWTVTPDGQVLDTNG